MAFFRTVYRFTPGALASLVLLVMLGVCCALALAILEHPEVLP